MKKTIDGITFKENNKLLLSKKELNEFLEKYKDDLKENNWDKIFESVNFAGDISNYPARLVYTLFFLNSDFMDYITELPEYVFYKCNFITSINLPNSVTKIGKYAFQGCTSLISITIPNSVTDIGESAFWGCDSLTSITIPNSVTKIEDSAFYDCTSLTSITIPSSVTKIEGWAFDGCTSLKTFTCSKNLKFNAKKIGLNGSVKIIRV